jgi:hypothetical protein
MLTTTIKRLTAVLLIICCSNTRADAPNAREILELEAAGFMDRYLAVYNRRLGHPDRSEQFRRELGDMVLMPLLVAPPRSRPRVPTSLNAFTTNFEGFVEILESRQVSRLEWQQVHLRVLSSNKILADNVGRGLNAAGETVYETASHYLLFRDDGAWKIALFSPYEVE